jgi:hypothetical protein
MAETVQKRMIQAFGTEHGHGVLASHGYDDRGPEDFSGGEGLLTALDVLARAIERNSAEERQLLTRLSSLHRALASGASVTETLASESAPGTLELVGRILGRLNDGSGTARRALARAMRAEGATVPAIAQAFGVTHQRVSNILSPPPAVSRLVLHDAVASASEHQRAGKTATDPRQQSVGTRRGTVTR